jgi:hypothetical protein
MLAIGAALGGLVAGTLGTSAAFVIDAATFLVSAGIIATITIPETHLDNRAPSSGLADLREGFRYIVGRRDVLIYALTKALWNLGGGLLVLLTIFGRRVFPLGVDGALSIGLLYTARGIGAGIGPIVVQRLGGSSVQFLRRAIGPAFLVTAAGYLLLAGAPSLALALVAISLAHTGGSTQWVFSTALLQMSVPPRLQGRVFSVDMALLTLTTAASSYTVSAMADAQWSPRMLAVAIAATFIPTGIALTLLLWRAPKTPYGAEGERAAVEEPAAAH